MADVQLGPTAQKVLELLQQNRGTAYSLDDVCEMVDCSSTQAQTALETLAHNGLIERQESVSGSVTYLAR
jgi:predicted transcriptional regulator